MENSWFVKIRVTLRTNDARDPAARNFADAVAKGFWREGAGRYEVLGLVSIAVFAPWSWHKEDLDEAAIRGAGLPGFEAGTWFGLFVPKNTPAPIIRTFNLALGKTLDNPAAQAKLRETGVTVVAPDRRSPEYLARFVASEVKKWEGPIKATGISM